MIIDHIYSCTSELVAEILMVITSYIIFGTILIQYLQTAFYFGNKKIIISDKATNLFLSSAYALFLPLMSYMFSQAEQHNLYKRAQVILIWMVIIEIIRERNTCTREALKSAEQLVRLTWVGFLVISYAPLQGIRVSLLVLCIYSAGCEILKRVMFNKGKDSYLVGKNPKIIHNYVKRRILQDDLQTTPMNSCSYIVMGEENHEIDVHSDGYLLGKEKSDSEGMLTIGKLFQLNLSEALTSAHPYWRDTGLSFALAKMLRCRFAKLPVNEAGCRKSLDFVLEGLIDYIGSNRDIQTDGRNVGERNSIERVFSIIQEELKFVSEFLETKVPTCYYFEWYRRVDQISSLIMIGNGFYLIWRTGGLSHTSQKGYNNCFFHVSKHASLVVEIFYFLDQLITYFLCLACMYIVLVGMMVFMNKRWNYLIFYKSYIKDPVKWNRSYNSLVAFMQRKLLSLLVSCSMVLQEALGDNFKEAGVYSTVFDKKVETVWFCTKENVSFLARLANSIGRQIISVHSADAKEAILRFLNNNRGRLTNGETSLRNYQMYNLIWACQPNGSTTEGIVVWHIATTLFHHQEPSSQQNNDSHQETAPKQNNNPIKKEQEVALSLSSYCFYLVNSLPELLPDEVDWTENMYQSVRKEISKPMKKKQMKKDRCNYALHEKWSESSVVGKGAKLAKDLMYCAEQRKEVWKMLAEFWAEMMLFIASSDKVEFHEKILKKEELITQLWALLTHAGIVTRCEPTFLQVHPSQSNAVTGDEVV